MDRSPVVRSVANCDQTVDEPGADTTQAISYRSRKLSEPVRDITYDRRVNLRDPTEAEATRTMDIARSAVAIGRLPLTYDKH